MSDILPINGNDLVNKSCGILMIIIDILDGNVLICSF